MIVRILYTNYRGETAWRRVIPMAKCPYFGKTEHHCPNAAKMDNRDTEDQWFIHVWDLGKNAERTLALKDIHQVVNGDGPIPPLPSSAKTWKVIGNTDGTGRVEGDKKLDELLEEARERYESSTLGVPATNPLAPRPLSTLYWPIIRKSDPERNKSECWSLSVSRKSWLDSQALQRPVVIRLCETLNCQERYEIPYKTEYLTRVDEGEGYWLIEAGALFEQGAKGVRRISEYAQADS